MRSGEFSVVQFSDCHLNPADKNSLDRFHAVRATIEGMKPDLVVASGDVSADGFANNGMFEQVKAELECWPMPVHVIPGNHDIGDKAGEANQVKPEYVNRWIQVFGQDHFMLERDEWMLIGLNTQIIGSGLHQETDQLRWLDHTVETAEQAGAKIAIFLHAAAYLFEPDEVLAGGSQYWGFDPDPRRELIKYLHRPNVRLVANGHLHWHHVFERGDAKWVWCPSIELIVDDAIFPRGGDVIGLIRYTFDDAGVEPELVPLNLSARRVHVFRPTLELPGRKPLTMAELVLDYTGTLSNNGQLLPGLEQRLHELSRRIRITVILADTSGAVESALAGLPLQLQVIKVDEDKRRIVETLGPAHTVAIGNGPNDVPMLESAALGIAVVGSQGASTDLVRKADVVVNNINEALDLITNPARLTATLRI